MKWLVTLSLFTLLGVVHAAAQSRIVDGDLVLEAAAIERGNVVLRLRGSAVVTTEDFVLRADAVDLISERHRRVIEARGNIVISPNPLLSANLETKKSQLTALQQRLGRNHPDLVRTTFEIQKLESKIRRLAECHAGGSGLKIDLPPRTRLDPRVSFLEQLEGAPPPVTEFSCSAL